MKLEIIWSHFAEKQIGEIFEYHKSEASLRVAKKLIAGLILSTDILADNPEIGPIEELLSERKVVYRYLVYKNYKIIYSVDANQQQIRITDIFDTRQNPVKISRNK